MRYVSSLFLFLLQGFVAFKVLGTNWRVLRRILLQNGTSGSKTYLSMGYDDAIDSVIPSPRSSCEQQLKLIQ